MTLNYRLFLLLFALVLAFYTRFAGLTRGESDFVFAERSYSRSTQSHSATQYHRAF